MELHSSIAREFGGRNANPGVVESQFGLVRVVQVPQATFLGREAYPAFSDKAAVLFWGIIQNSPFKDSNRRLAFAALVAFCDINGATIDAKFLDEKKLENLTKRASHAKQDGLAPETVFGEIRTLLKQGIKHK